MRLAGRARGSTAVCGLAAKPIVDILLVVTDASDEAAYVPPLPAEQRGQLSDSCTRACVVSLSTAAGCRAECEGVCVGSALTSALQCDILPPT